MLEPRKSPAVWASSYESDNAHVAVRCRIHGHEVRRSSATHDNAILCYVQAAEVSQVPVGSGRTSFITFLSIVDLRPPNHSKQTDITFIFDRVCTEYADSMHMILYTMQSEAQNTPLRVAQ